MPSTSVSRTGACQRCHRRKVKCDRTRPSCAPCARINVQCTYAAREHQIQLRRQDVERLEQRIRDLQAENDNLTGRLADVQQQPQQAGNDDRLATPNTTSSMGLQSDDTHPQPGSGEIASQVIHLSLNAGGGRDFVGSTSGLFLANLLQSHSQSIGSSHHVVDQHSRSTSRHLNRSGSLASNGVLSLPPKSLTTEILDAYCSHDRLCYPFLPPKALNRALDAVYDARNSDTADPVDSFLIDMTLAIGTAQVYKLNWNSIWDAEVHYNRAMTRLGDVLSRGGITALQALLLICQYRMGTTSHDTSTSVWHLIGVAARTCFELGLHKASTYAPHQLRDGSEGNTAVRQDDVETKRRCFWSVVSMDRIASLILGRPLAIQLEDIDVELPHFDMPASIPLHHSLSTASFGTPEWHLGTSIFVHIVRYRLICGKILNILHRSTGPNRESTITYENSRNALVEELQSWRTETTNLPLIPADAPLASLASRSSFRSADDQPLRQLTSLEKNQLFLGDIAFHFHRRVILYLRPAQPFVARLNGLEKQLGLSSVEYSTCVSILFVGYILGQIPSNMILTRVRPSWYMGGFMMAWAVVSALTAIVKDYKGLVLTRFFLGVVEAPYYPGALYILSIFYTRKELATRISVLYSGNILATAFAGLIAAGVFHGLEGVNGLEGWRWLFILQGAVTLAIAMVACFTLPDEPLTTRWLTPAERQLAHARIERDTVGARVQSSTWAGLREAIVDPKVWVFIYMQHMHLATNGFKNFFPTIVETLNFNTTITLVLTCPPYLIAGVLSIAWAWSSGKYNERMWHITISKCVALFGFVLACATMNTGARYFAMVVFTVGTYGVNSILLGWVGSTCGQTKEKKASALAIVNTSASISFIWTPYLWPTSDAPRYVIPMASSAAFCVACAAGAWLMKWMLVKENRKIRQSDQEATLFYAY
ncbi:major facilitator superfamily transporter [Colletotrichum incanum]|nr:major facilitator superfamily transporter [Colletotrichum incanum]